MKDVTALIPIHRRNGNREWLQQAVNSLGPDIKTLVLENDGEVADAYNVGLKTAQTEYVLFMGADDIAHPDMLHELHAAIWDVDVTYPRMTLVSEDLQDPVGEHPAQVFCPYRLQQANYISGVALVRREKALAVGGFRDMPVLEDWDLWVRMSRAGARFKPVPMARLFYRQVEGSRNKNTAVDWAAVARSVVGDQDPTGSLPATFYASATPAVAYVRCQLPARYLPGLVMPDPPDVRLGPNGEHQFVQHRGAAVFQLAAAKSVAVIAKQMQADGVRVLVESDDNYPSDSADFRKRARWAKRIGDGPFSVQGHLAIAREADGVIVTTDYLANAYRKINPNVFVCPNTVDPQDWQPLSKPDDGVFRIGWFASASHAGDGRLVRRALEWASRQKNVEVVALGLNPGWRFPYKQLPWATDLSAYRKAMQYIDVGVAPIVATPFSRGRSDLKWLEYSMSGVATVCSDIEPYATVPDGLAMKARDAKGFLDAVRHLVRNQDQARQMASDARSYVLARRTIEKQLHRWKEALSA